MQTDILDIQNALTPLDGRNRKKLLSLVPIFSDLALLKFRIQVELAYFKKLSEMRVLQAESPEFPLKYSPKPRTESPKEAIHHHLYKTGLSGTGVKIIRNLTPQEKKLLKDLTDNIGDKEYQEVRDIEKIVNHDVKAVEEFLKTKLQQTSLKDISGMIHFGLTADDTNNLSYAKMLHAGLTKVLLPELDKIFAALKKKSVAYKNIVMLGRTHGQPALPTTIGKEIFVYYRRLEEEVKILKSLKIKAKLTGNVGNLNAHKFLFPKINWLKFSKDFVSELGFIPDLATTQIEPYDSYIRIFNNLERINNILLGMCQDFWIYISQGYFKQLVIQKEVGSTALPHKVNPIYFEGAEGGLGLANALFNFYSRKLSYSRLQRDLSDSTVKRSFGIAFSYSLLSYQSIITALERIEPNEDNLKSDYENRFEILSEAVQNYLRLLGHKDGYEKSKAFFRGQEINQRQYQEFIKSLKLNKEAQIKLLSLTPANYTGYASEIVKNVQ